MRAKWILSLLAVLFSSLLLTAEAQQQVNVKKKTASERKFNRLMHRDNTVILDVRTAEEYAAGHIPGAINMDVNKEDFRQQVQGLDKSKTYLLYCKSGKRSEKALRIMDSTEFKRLYHLKGGYTAWTAPGR